MAKRGENIYKRRDGRYEGRYVIGRTERGRTRFGYVYAHSYHQARAALILKKAQFQTEAQKDFGQSALRMDQLMQTWLAQWAQPRVRPSTYANYCRLAKHVLIGLGGIRLDRLSSRDISDFFARPPFCSMACSTQRSLLRLLRSALKQAAQVGRIGQNPAAMIRMKTGYAPDQRVLTRREQALLTRWAMEKESLPVLIALYGGLRIGEISALCWQDVSWAEKTLTVSRAAQRLYDPNREGSRLILGRPKSQAAQRTVPLPGFLLRMLKARQAAGGDETFVFGRNGAPADPRTLQYRLAAMAQRLGLTGVHFHTMRHAYATRLLECGIDVKTVSELLGHSSPQITLACYAHATQEQKRQAVKRLEKLIA